MQGHDRGKAVICKKLRYKATQSQTLRVLDHMGRFVHVCKNVGQPKTMLLMKWCFYRLMGLKTKWVLSLWSGCSFHVQNSGRVFWLSIGPTWMRILSSSHCIQKYDWKLHSDFVLLSMAHSLGRLLYAYLHPPSGAHEGSKSLPFMMKILVWYFVNGHS